jgi:chemotaxis protein CheX
MSVENLPDKIMASVQEIFSSMVVMDILPGAPILGEINPLQSTITGMIGLAGTHKGMLAIHLPEALAKKVTGNFLGMDVDEIDNDVQDAIGELANMLGGSIKAILSENGKDIKLSMPSTICGQEYRFQSHYEGESVIVPFAAEDSQFLVELRIKKED